MTSTDLYERAPLGVRDEIPLFSQPSSYTENYEQISGDHLAALAKDGHNPFIGEELWRELEASTLALVRKYLPPGGVLLDVGVGLGRLLEQLPGHERHGMDISLGYLAQARQKGIRVCYAMVEDMPFRAASFDLITCTDVLEHVLDLHRACEQILRVLKPGGTLVLRVPYKEDLSAYLAADYPYKYVHLRSFDKPSLRILFERVFDCQVLETSGVGAYASLNLYRYPSPWRLFDRIVRRIAAHTGGRDGWLVQKLYRPVELNVVIRKPAGA